MDRALSSTVLVVDDERDFVDTLATLLRMHGHRVVTASDGAQALRILAGDAVDVVLTDIAMPGLDGFRLLKAVRTHPDCRDTLVIAVTGWGGRDADTACAVAGFDAFFTKPCELRDLLWTIGSGALHARRRLQVPPRSTAAPVR